MSESITEPRTARLQDSVDGSTLVVSCDAKHYEKRSMMSPAVDCSELAALGSIAPRWRR